MPRKKEPTVEFKSVSDMAQAEDEFASLKNHPGWKRIVAYYDNKTKYLESLLHEGEINDIPELKLIRARRNMSIQFRNLPDILLEFIQRGTPGIPDLDPYEK